MTDPTSGSPDYRALLKRSLAAIQQLESKLAAVEQARVEPIAIVGIGCRFPGGVTNVETYWELLRNGVDAVSEVPADRWSIADTYDPDPDTIGKTYTKWGGFLDDVDKFDAAFFGISPREATSMDPQHRVLLEVSWEALENAGIAPTSLAGSRTAVYLGISTHDYSNQFCEIVGLTYADAYAASGAAHAVASGRVSYFLGLHGPNAPIDTACSSSSVAIHLAAQSLRSQESNVALAAGVNLTLTVSGSILTSRARMMSFDGRCKTFDASADGYVRSEGCGVLVLKRLSDARRDGDRILALIRGSAVNQDGRSSGLTAPNGVAQETVIRDALTNARLAPDDIDVVEAHGTGTALGDPIEMNALGKVFGQRDPAHPLYVGSVKTNIGHAEGSAGIAGVIKTVLALQHKQIPPHLHLKTPNPLIPWSSLPIKVPLSLTPWIAQEQSVEGRSNATKPRRAGVSAFGFSGTNTHIVLEEAPAEVVAVGQDDASPKLLVCSAQTTAALRASAEQLREYLRRSDAASLPDVAFTAGIGRAHFVERLAIVAADRATAAERLDAFLSEPDGITPACAARGRSPAGTTPEFAFLFTGQGAQRFGMGRELYETQPVFRDALDACAVVIDPIVGRSLIDVMFRDESARDLLDDTAFTQPALFAIEYALAQLWRAWGVEPTMMMGHSVGEYVAACIAGVFSLADAARLIAHRGRLMSALPRDGSMVAIFADRERVTRALVGFEADVSIGAANGPTNTVIAGRASAIEQILKQLAADEIEFQRLNVSHAFHSPLMDPMLDEFERIASTIRYSEPRIGVVSNVTGRIAGPEIATPAYWRRHVRAPVLFVDGVETLLIEGMRTFVEVGPSPTLSRMAQRCPGAEGAAWLSSLRKDHGDSQAMLDTLGQLYVRGQRVDWASLAGPGPRRTELPTYPFQRERFWHDLTPRSASRQRLVAGRDTKHPLLGSRLAGPLHVYQSRLSTADVPWLIDHQILDLVLFPGTGFFELALAAARQTTGQDVRLEDVVIRDRLVLPNEGGVMAQVIVTPTPEGTYTVDVYTAEVDNTDASASPENWRRHLSANVIAADDGVRPMPTRELRGDVVDYDVAEHYDRLRERGAQYGPTFQGIRSLQRSGDELLARVELPSEIASSAAALHLHPALLDAGLQVVGAGMSGEGMSVPVAVDTIDVFRSGATKAWVHVVVHPVPANATSVRSDLTLFDDDGAIIAAVRGLVFQRVTRDLLERRGPTTTRNDWLYEVHWQSAPLADNAAAPRGQWLIVGDSERLAPSLASRLRERGASVAVGAPHNEAHSLNGVVILLGVDPSAGDADLASLKQSYATQIEAVLAIVPSIAESGTRLWLVTRGSQSVADSVPDLQGAPAWGLGGVIASEYPALRAVRVDLDPGRPPSEDIDLLVALFATDDREDRVALRGGNRYVARLTSGALVPSEQETPRRLEITARGVLENLVLVPVERTPPGPGEIEIRVAATGLNFRDVLNALGMYPGDPGPLGNECAGVVTAVGAGVDEFVVGDEVITMVDRSFATYAIARAALTVRKPNSLTFVEAATIPVAFLTAEYALMHLGRLKPGERVLIHAATGGVGMAAVQIARRAGAEIFGTAGTPAKRSLARTLGVNHVADSRSLTFAEDVRRDSGGGGVDVVLNSLAGDFIPESLRLLRAGGRFIEIGKTGIWDANTVGETFPGLEYYPLYLGEIAAAEPKVVRDMLQRIVDDMVSGVLTPLPATVYPFERSEAAFRFMGQGRHIGKIVITQRVRPEIRSDATYLITGGLGGLGLECARYLADHGARSLVLVGRRSPAPDARAIIAGLEQRGVAVAVASIDVTQASDVAGLLETIAGSLPPLRGILHAAGVTDDGMIAEQTIERFERVMGPKVDGTWHLHSLTRHLPIDLFVLFSSGAALLGSPGQGNYAAANAFMDSLAFVREAEGRPALSVNWGAWADVGMGARVDEQHRRRWAEQGLRVIRPAEGVRMLHDALRGAVLPNIAILPLDRRRLPSSLAPFYERLTSVEASTRTRDAATGDVSRRVRDAGPRERPALLTAFLIDQLTRVLAIDRATPLQTDLSVMQMGLDSLMAMELRNRVHTGLQVRISVADLLAGPTITELVAAIMSVMDAEAPSRDNDSASRDTHVEQLSDAEVDAALAELLREDVA